ncbi:hypothetical protein QQ045_022300 [Rhodiola kirilowii]
MGNCMRRSQVGVHPLNRYQRGEVDRPRRLRIKVRMTTAQFHEMVDRSRVEAELGEMILEECLRKGIYVV